MSLRRMNLKRCVCDLPQAGLACGWGCDFGLLAGLAQTAIVWSGVGHRVDRAVTEKAGARRNLTVTGV